MASQKKGPEKKSGWSNLVNSKPKKIVVFVIGVILVLNIMWTLKQNDASVVPATLKEDLAKLEQRIADLEKTAKPDVETLRAEFDRVKKIGEGYEARLVALLEAEEEGLAAMKKEVEAREAWLESLKKAASEEKSGD